jgi:hypothetical protein
MAIDWITMNAKGRKRLVSLINWLKKLKDRKSVV